MVATRISPGLGLPSGTCTGFNRFGSLGPPMGAPTAAAPLATGGFDFLVRRQLRAILPLDLASDQLLDLSDRLLIDA